MPLGPLAAVTAALAVTLAGCGGGSNAAPPTRTPPDLAAFLRLPVATPSACPASTNGTTVGRHSPWVGHVDISVYASPSATPAQFKALGAELTGEAGVSRVYRETRNQAYAEFQRLYTCSDNVPRSAVPASYRIVLDPITQSERDDLVRRLDGLPGVGSVSCDPSNPCVNVQRGG